MDHNSPRRLSVPLADTIYKLEVDVRRDRCNKKDPHWHLYKNGNKIARIGIRSYQIEKATCELSTELITEIISLTERYSPEINRTYNYNAFYGAG